MRETLLIGSGNMAMAYCEVLKAQKEKFTVVGNSIKKADEFKGKTNVYCHSGGIENYLSNTKTKPSHAIVSVQVEKLFKFSSLLVKKGIKNILVEKPGGINQNEIQELASLSKHKCNLFVAYNRRFYQSVLAAQNEIKNDGGVLSARFEFTEWSHVIEKINKPDALKKNWFLANSSHVIDLVFSIIGKPKKISSFTSGDIGWHKPSIYGGAGITESNCIFSYYANWESAGRWGIELNTSKRKLILSPLEILQEQLIGSIEANKISFDYSIDEKFKAGIYYQVEAFLKDQKEKLKSIEEQMKDLEHLSKINGDVK